MFLLRFASSFQPGPWLPLSSWTYLLRRVWIKLAGLPHSPRHPQGDHDSVCSKKLSVCGGTPLSSQTIPMGWLCWIRGQSRAQGQGQGRDHALSPWSPSRSSDSPGTENRKEQRTQPKTSREVGKDLVDAGSAALGGEASQEGGNCWDGLHTWRPGQRHTQLQKATRSQ